MNVANDTALEYTLSGKTAANAAIRNYSVDAFRLAAAMAVVVGHTIYSVDFPGPVYFLIWNLIRWAVPFFFLIAGYYFQQAYKAQGGNALLKRLKSLIGIFISVNIIFFFVNLYIGRSPEKSFSFYALAAGNYAHLWFIGSMILGYLVMWFLLEQRFKKLTLAAIIVFFLLLILGTGSYAGMLGYHTSVYGFSRHLISIPFMLIGYLCARHKLLANISLPLAITIALFGLVLQMAEASFLEKTINSDTVSHDFLVGTLFFAFGTFAFSFKTVSKGDNLIAKLGRDYSLLIYLYHPIILCSRYTNLYQLTGNYHVAWVRPIAVFLLCLGFILIVEKFLPPVYRFIGGAIWK